MFKKKRTNSETESTYLTKGWTPSLIEWLMEGDSDKEKLGFNTIDFDTLVTGLNIKSNNFEIERTAYGTCRLLDDETYVYLPVVIYFLLQQDENYRSFDNLSIPGDLYSPARQGRVYGRSILNEYPMQGRGGKRIRIPVFEWHLYLESNEWDFVQKMFDISDAKSLPKIGIRIGLPSSVSMESIVNDSVNSRLLIYRLWTDSIKVYDSVALGKNDAFKKDIWW